jgi:hypothetical protein
MFQFFYCCSWLIQSALLIPMLKVKSGNGEGSGKQHNVDNVKERNSSLMLERADRCTAGSSK